GFCARHGAPAAARRDGSWVRRLYSRPWTKRRHECRRGTQECVRHDSLLLLEDGLGGGRREVTGRASGFETVGFVLAVAERFVLGESAAAERYHGASGEAEYVALRVLDEEVIAFDAHRSVVVDCDFGRCHQKRW